MRIKSIALLFLFAWSWSAMAQPLRICDDAAEWPPFMYYPRVNGQSDRSHVTGAVAELLKEVFKMLKMDYSVTLLPWKRCMSEVDNFDQTRRYEAFVNGSFNMERAEKYYLTTPLYSMHDGIFYSRTKYPKGFPLKKPSDLNRFTLCGVLGYNYEHLYSYGISRGKIIDTGTKTIAMALEKISRGRCDVFNGGIETVYGGATAGLYQIPENVVHMPLPGVEPITYHMFIAKTSPRAYELVAKINQALLILQHNGVSKRIFEKYLPMQRKAKK
jgi:polar amino acid transport system substrate-binding protein